MALTKISLWLIASSSCNNKLNIKAASSDECLAAAVYCHIDVYKVGLPSCVMDNVWWSSSFIDEPQNRCIVTVSRFGELFDFKVLKWYWYWLNQWENISRRSLLKYDLWKSWKLCQNQILESCMSSGARGSIFFIFLEALLSHFVMDISANHKIIKFFTWFDKWKFSWDFKQCIF